MTLQQLIEKADAGYPDGKVLEAYEAYSDPTSTQDVGDGLAVFIAVELAETFDPCATDKEQTAEALRVMNTARDEINGVINALEEWTHGRISNNMEN